MMASIKIENKTEARSCYKCTGSNAAVLLKQGGQLGDACHREKRWMLLMMARSKSACK
jgi:hypothetical protein